eukprot:TRINITY_DN14159_c0_g1_i1.p1 TRINITY_DN14159_c0_g1~~TRINITY_DN14159_c0_g1_i1.p1  ORF type:complete len:302 (+),score=50.63 TRINITY_DN14159_c0_g1_i1:227-1132(+)
MSPSPTSFIHHQHGKSRVRVARVWRDGPVHSIVEWNVNISLLSEAETAFLDGDNSNLVATDTMKNTVYVIAKQCAEKESPEGFALKLAHHFVNLYPPVHGAKVSVVEKPWERMTVNGQPHDHGFKLDTAEHTVDVEVDDKGKEVVTSGVQNLSLLKTTQSGFEGFIRDKYTVLPETRERIVASSIRATWTYSGKPRCFQVAYESIKKTLVETFLGPAVGGTYSPSVQHTLHQMARAVLDKAPEVASVYLNMPNLHFLPYSAPSIGQKFADDIYLPTSEPHGTIEAYLGRGGQNGARLPSRL